MYIFNCRQAGMTLKEALANGYKKADAEYQSGYVSRKCNELEQPVYIAGGSRKGALFVLLPNRGSTRFCFRVYLSRPEES